MFRGVLGWLAWLQDRDIEGTALSFVVCQLTLAIAATAGTWINEAAVLLFLPTVLLAAFFLRFIDGCLVLLTAFVATWYFVIPPADSFALTTGGVVQLAVFTAVSGLIIAAAVRMRRVLKRRQPLPAGLLPAKPDLIAER